MIVWSLTSALTFEEVLCLALCSASTAKGGGTIVRILFFTARKNIDDYWMNPYEQQRDPPTPCSGRPRLVPKLCLEQQAKRLQLQD